MTISEGANTSKPEVHMRASIDISSPKNRNLSAGSYGTSRSSEAKLNENPAAQNRAG
eukprot:CAMPEP_0173116370 /NCGR_PEP_ID=MMETSP1102-20130122/49295_1 /TAXON_ID=49646 /ORGANISM="Geminigera sp., Strain Caron Lab Isolate" /LENGTH=56 /DNA_ID=CAMNT_0014020063 /DNA_START=41 /DNA_END=208 /DNA_ORIENTATION=-